MSRSPERKRSGCTESDESATAVARRLGLGPETFRKWVRQHEIKRGAR